MVSNVLDIAQFSGFGLTSLCQNAGLLVGLGVKSHNPKPQALKLNSNPWA